MIYNTPAQHFSNHPGFTSGLHSQEVKNSIRDKLEKDAWQTDPLLAKRMASRFQAGTTPRKSLRWQDRTLLVLAIVLLGLVLLRIETAQADESQWGIELQSSGVRTVQLALNTDIQVEVTGLIARTQVTQVFSNPGDEWAEGIYRFPLPDGAAVDRMHIQVGDRIIASEIKERGTARRVYQKAVSNGVTASLVEQQKENQFETRLANIGPGESISVTIGFLLNVKFEEGAFSLRLPMTFTPRGGAQNQNLQHLGEWVPQPNLIPAQASNDHYLNLEVHIKTAIGFAAIESRYYDVDIEPGPDGYKINLSDELERNNRDFELVWFPDLQSVPQSSLITWDGADATYAQLMLVPPLAGSIENQAREVIFIIDTSGSMEGESIKQARTALIKGLDELTVHDRFNLIQFNSDTEVLFRESMPAIPRHLDSARYYIEDLVADGGTVMEPALHAAFSLPEQFAMMRQVIFVTDGSVGNEKDLLAAIANDLGRSRLFTIGIGSAPNTWFMRKAAEVGRGSHTHIGNLNEVEAKMAMLWSHIRLPALSDICVDWGTQAEYYPEIIPDLYAGQPLWVVAKLPLQPGQITICGTLNGQPWEQVDQPFTNEGTETLATLWAKKKIESLEEGIVFGADIDQSNAEILQVALNYGLLTSQTSMVAVDQAPARPVDKSIATGTVPGLLPAGSSQVVNFAQTATGWKTQIFLSLLTLLLATWMLRSSIAIGTRSTSS